MKRVLALDLAIDVSWAVRARDGGVVCGTDSFRSKQIQTSGIRFIRFRNWLAELCGEAKAQAIVYRESDAAAHRAWIPHLLEYSQRAGVPLQSITSGRVKRFTVGRGSAPMEAVLAAVKDMSYQPGNENEAVAIALLSLIEDEANRRLAAVPFSFPPDRLNGA